MLNQDWRQHLYLIIFESNTRAGRNFDIALLAAILASVLTVSLESVDEIKQSCGIWLVVAEWIFTLLFTVEYVLRLVSSPRPVRYAGSFFGIVDLLSILPTCLSFFFPGTQALVSIRALRMLRIFRILKLGNYLREAETLREALRASRPKVTVFLTVVMTVVAIVGSAMYLIEGPESGFTSVPRSMYWAVVTMTTVGYGDIAPQSVLGQLLASALMVMGYGVLAVPTGIVSVELARADRHRAEQRHCPHCLSVGHSDDAKYCKRCGNPLAEAQTESLG